MTFVKNYQKTSEILCRPKWTKNRSILTNIGLKAELSSFEFRFRPSIFEFRGSRFDFEFRFWRFDFETKICAKDICFYFPGN